MLFKFMMVFQLGDVQLHCRTRGRKTEQRKKDRRPKKITKLYKSRENVYERSHPVP